MNEDNQLLINMLDYFMAIFLYNCLNLILHHSNASVLREFLHGESKRRSILGTGLLLLLTI
jgi:hypothetical protein